LYFRKDEYMKALDVTRMMKQIGHIGGKKSAEALTTEQRSEKARKAAKARWAKKALNEK
jgi:hypothetical protein